MRGLATGMGAATVRGAQKAMESRVSAQESATSAPRSANSARNTDRWQRASLSQ